MRVCTSCKVAKPESEFHRFGKDQSRIGKWCESCYVRNKKKTRNRNMPNQQGATN